MGSNQERMTIMTGININSETNPKTDFANTDPLEIFALIKPYCKA